jgi:hypothetical protein
MSLGTTVLAAALALTLAGCDGGSDTAHRPAAPASTGPTAPSPSASAAARASYPWETPLRGPHRRGHLRPGSRPGVLPGDLLIADKLNNRLVIVDPHGRVRWTFPRPGDLAKGQTFKIPDDAFFTPDGRYIVATEEDNFVIRLVDVARHRIVYTYGKPGVPGDGPNRLWNPDDAVGLPDGSLVTADIKNHRLLLIRHRAHHPARQWGDVNHGYHDPPRHYGAPNGMLPMGHGRFLVTEIRGAWVDSVDLHGHRFWSTHPPGVLYPSDSNRVGPNRYLTVDYSDSGQIVMFTRSGRLLWRFAPPGRDRLDHPSLALPLPNGDVVANDDRNHRVIVVDPRTNKIVWQYGHTGLPGRKPGYLYNPDGLDLVPPHSFVQRTLSGQLR